MGALVVTCSACRTFDGLPTIDADAGAPDTAATAPDAGAGLLDMTAAAKICAMAVDCRAVAGSITLSTAVPLFTNADDAPTFSWCMTWLAGPLDSARVGLAAQRAYFQKVASAADCSAAVAASPVQAAALASRACADPTGFCDAKGFVARCGVLTTCGPPLFPSGSRCAAGAGTATCGEPGPCMLGCLADGVSLVTCSPGVKTTTDCSFTGRKCGPDPALGGAPTCIAGDGTSLTACRDGTSGGSACSDATHVRSCWGRLADSRYDCAAIGATCVATVGGQGAFCAAHAGCNPFGADVNVCDPTTGALKMCLSGALATFDCKSIGKTCTMTAGAANCR